MQSLLIKKMTSAQDGALQVVKLYFFIFGNSVNVNLNLNFRNKWVSMTASISMGQGDPYKGFSIK